MIRKNVWLLIGLLLAVGLIVPGLTGTAEARPRPTQYVLPGDQVFPEGVAYQRGTPFFYVSSTTDGTIFRGNLKEAQAEVFLPGGGDGRTTAVGLEVDRSGRLFIAGGATGQAFVYDTATGDLIAALDNGVNGPTFVNDVAVDRDGVAYFTDSQNPVLYRAAPDAAGQYTLEPFIDFTGTAIQYQTGFNLNGIDITPSGKYLIVVQSNTGRLFRIEIATQQVAAIDLGGAVVTAGDGILLQGRTLYVVRNALGQIDVVRLAGDLLRGEIVDSITDPSFIFPTTTDLAQGRLLVVNSQFNNRSGTPVLPFTVSAVARR